MQPAQAPILTKPRKKSLFASPLILMLAAATAFGQVPVAAPGNGRFDPAESQRRYERRLRDALEADDAQWEQLEPRIARIRELKADLAIGMGAGMDMMGPPPGAPGVHPVGFFQDSMGGPLPPEGEQDFGGPPPPDNQDSRRASPVQARYYDLQEALDDPATTPAAYAVRIAALRQARSITQVKLKKAQADLRRRVTPLQEAVLITIGLLD